MDSYNLLLWVLSRLDVNKCLEVAGKMSGSLARMKGIPAANQKTFAIVIDACVRTKRLEGAIGFINQIGIVRYSARAVELTYKLVELCYSENNVKAARVCQDVLGQLSSQNMSQNGGHPEYPSQMQGQMWGYQRKLSAWIAERENNR